jgi:hypothetical protein
MTKGELFEVLKDCPDDLQIIIKIDPDERTHALLEVATADFRLFYIESDEENTLIDINTSDPETEYGIEDENTWEKILKQKPCIALFSSKWDASVHYSDPSKHLPWGS